MKFTIHLPVDTFWVSIYLGAALWVLWFLYSGVMNLYRVKKSGTMTREQLVLGMPWLWLGLLLDIFLNMVALTLIGLELPQESLMTSRLSRWKYSTNTGLMSRWRRAVATWFCERLLDSLDPSGCHCKSS